LSARRTLVVAVAAVVLVAAALLVAGPARRLANVDGDGHAPLYDRPLDDRSLRRAGELVPDDATYYVDASGADPLSQGNLKAAAQLYLAPALPVLDPERAQWVVRLERGGAVRAQRSP
jgi:hypothetical protein